MNLPFISAALTGLPTGLPELPAGARWHVTVLPRHGPPTEASVPTEELARWVSPNAVTWIHRTEPLRPRAGEPAPGPEEWDFRPGALGDQFVLPLPSDGDPTAGSLELIVGDHWVLTAGGPSELFNDLRADIRRVQPMVHGAGEGLATVLEVLVHAFFVRAEALVRRVNEAEEQLLERVTREDVRRIFALRREINVLVGRLRAVRAVLGRASRSRSRHLDRLARRRLDALTGAVTDQINEAERTLSTFAHLTNVARTFVSYRTGEAIYLLLVLCVFVLPASLLTGVYAMNFERMPELRHPYGYPLALLAMAALTVTVAFALRRTGWFGRPRHQWRRKVRAVARSPVNRRPVREVRDDLH